MIYKVIILLLLLLYINIIYSLPISLIESYGYKHNDVIKIESSMSDTCKATNISLPLKLKPLPDCGLGCDPERMLSPQERMARYMEAVEKRNRLLNLYERECLHRRVEDMSQKARALEQAADNIRSKYLDMESQKKYTLTVLNQDKAALTTIEKHESSALNHVQKEELKELKRQSIRELASEQQAKKNKADAYVRNLHRQKILNTVNERRERTQRVEIQEERQKRAEESAKILKARQFEMDAQLQAKRQAQSLNEQQVKLRKQTLAEKATKRHLARNAVDYRRQKTIHDHLKATRKNEEDAKRKLKQVLSKTNKAQPKKAVHTRVEKMAKRMKRQKHQMMKLRLMEKKEKRISRRLKRQQKEIKKKSVKHRERQRKHKRRHNKRKHGRHSKHGCSKKKHKKHGCKKGQHHHKRHHSHKHHHKRKHHHKHKQQHKQKHHSKRKTPNPKSLVAAKTVPSRQRPKQGKAGGKNSRKSKTRQPLIVDKLSAPNGSTISRMSKQPKPVTPNTGGNKKGGAKAKPPPATKGGTNIVVKLGKDGPKISKEQRKSRRSRSRSKRSRRNRKSRRSKRRRSKRRRSKRRRSRRRRSRRRRSRRRRNKRRRSRRRSKRKTAKAKFREILPNESAVYNINMGQTPPAIQQGGTEIVKDLDNQAQQAAMELEFTSA